MQAAAESLGCESSGEVCNSLVHTTGRLGSRGCGWAVRVADAVVAAGPVDAELAAVGVQVEWAGDGMTAVGRLSDVLALIQGKVDAEDRADRAEATLAKVAALGGEPYVLADVLCHLYHDFDITALTGFATESGFVVSCATCKANAGHVLLAILDADPAPESKAEVKVCAWCEAEEGLTQVDGETLCPSCVDKADDDH